MWKGTGEGGGGKFPLDVGRVSLLLGPGVKEELEFLFLGMKILN